MTMTNHMAVGAIVAYVIKQPTLALLLAFLSHFLLDALPHFGDNGVAKEGYFSSLKRTVVIIDCVFATLLLAWLISQHTLFAIVCAVAAVSPDFVWVYREIVIKIWGSAKPRNVITRFHEKIQWGEFPWGWIPEIGYLTGSLLVLARIAA